MDNMPWDFCGYLSQLDDSDFLEVLFGQYISLKPEFFDDFTVHSARFLHESIERSNLISF